MNDFIKLLGQKYPSILDAEANIMSFVNSIQKKHPYLNEEDLQQLVLMMGVDQGEIDEGDYQQMIQGRETTGGIEQLVQETGGSEVNGVSSQFSGLKQLVKGK